MLHSGSFGGPSANARAIEWFEKAAAQDNATAKLCLALLLLHGEDVAHDRERARGLLHDAADSGQPAAMFHLGEMYRLGHGEPPDASQAESWLRRAAARGHVKALLSLVQLFESGPEPDANTAAVLCRQAAELGDGEAQYWLGQFYLAGKGVPSDPMEAARWISKAADQGVTAAYERLGALYAEGHGLPQDFQAAADWFNRAAVNGDANALYHLGTLQLRGLGIPRDPVRQSRVTEARQRKATVPPVFNSALFTPPARMFRKIMPKRPDGIRGQPSRVCWKDITTWRSCTCAAWACGKIRRLRLNSWSRLRKRAAFRPLGLCTISSPRVPMW